MMFLKFLLKKLKQFTKEAPSFLACFLIAFYKSFLSGTLGSGGCCRFYPSCGEYAFLVYKKHSFFKATKLTATRLLSCHPFGPKWKNEELFERGF